MSEKKYTKEYEVNGFDLDTRYRLKKHLMAAYFQNTMACEFADLKLAAYDLQEEGRTWVLTEMGVDYGGVMPRWREKFIVHSWTRKVSGFRVYRDFYAENSGGELLARGTAAMLVLNEETRRPEKLGHIAEILQPLAEEVYPEYTSRIEKPEMVGEKYRLSGSVRSFDIDFNNHLNNIRYIAAAIEPLPYDYRESHSLSSFIIKYSEEAYLHDSLIAECFGEKNEFYHTIRREEGESSLCSMVSRWRAAE